MQALRNFLVDRFTVNNRFQRFLGKASVHKTPVIFLGILFNGVITVTIALTVTTVSALEHVEVQPLSFVKPHSRCGTTPRMESHQVVFINCTDAFG
ncbi:hypothetical protein SDC9_109344 [bioreactor metagenome]|uniref:Uncharacterized protein n=1 Tax=bioreactor metagenome TaxID=1076179 RepID=A0A645BAX5_9ZZZZ